MQAEKDDLGYGDMQGGGLKAPQQGRRRKPKKEDTQMDLKKEDSKTVAAAIERVAKSSASDYAAAVAKALQVAVDMINECRTDITKSGDVPGDFYSDIYLVKQVLDTCVYGYPMVPAIPDEVAKAAKKIPAGDFMEHAATELEATVKDPIEKRALRITALKVALVAFDAAADDAEVAIVTPEALLPVLQAEAAKQAVEKAEKEKAEKAAQDAVKTGGDKTGAEPAKASAAERIEAVAKAAALPPRAVWPADLSAKASRGKR